MLFFVKKSEKVWFKCVSGCIQNKTFIGIMTLFETRRDVVSARKFVTKMKMIHKLILILGVRRYVHALVYDTWTKRKRRRKGKKKRKRKTTTSSLSKYRGKSGPVEGIDSFLFTYGFKS